MTPGRLPRQARTRWRAATEHRASSPSAQRSYGGAEPVGAAGAAEPQAASQHNTTTGGGITGKLPKPQPGAGTHTRAETRNLQQRGAGQGDSQSRRWTHAQPQEHTNDRQGSTPHTHHDGITTATTASPRRRQHHHGADGSTTAPTATPRRRRRRSSFWRATTRSWTIFVPSSR